MTEARILRESLGQLDCAPHIARYGCYSWVPAMDAQLKTGILFTRARFEQLLNEAGKRLRYDGKPVVNPETVTLNDPQAWGQMCFDALAPGRFKFWQVGTQEGFYWPPGAAKPKWYAGPQTDDYSFLALKWGRGVDKDGGPKFHFTYFDPYKGIAWDPHGKLRPLSPVPLRVVMYLVEVA